MNDLRSTQVEFLDCFLEGDTEGTVDLARRSLARGIEPVVFFE